MSTSSTEVEQYGGNELLDKYAGGVPEDLETGMDELEDGSHPRIRINHKDARYVESIGETEWEYLDCIILGFSYSRVMWKPKKTGQSFNGDELPQCRSNDNKNGQPNTTIDKPSLFPWGDSVFDPQKAQVNPVFNRVLLDCTKCSFQIWGADGTRPACGLIMNVYVLYQPPGSDSTVTAYMSIKGAGIKPMKQFFQKIRQRGKDATPYQFRVQLSLETHTSGEVEFCTPKVEVVDTIASEAWPILSEHYSQMRAFTKAIIIEPEDKEISVNGYIPPVSQDEHFVMSTNELKDGVDPSRSGGGRRSAPPPSRRNEITSGVSADPLAGVMGGVTQTIQGSVESSVTHEPAQASVQVPAQQASPPPQQAAPPAPATPEPNLSAPMQAATPVAPQPPQQSAPPPAQPSSVTRPPMAAPPMMATMPMAGHFPAQAQAVTQVAEAAPAEKPLPWETALPPSPTDYVSADVDAEGEPDDVNDAAFPFS